MKKFLSLFLLAFFFLHRGCAATITLEGVELPEGSLTVKYMPTFLENPSLATLIASETALYDGQEREVRAKIGERFPEGEPTFEGVVDARLERFGEPIDEEKSSAFFRFVDYVQLQRKLERYREQAASMRHMLSSAIRWAYAIEKHPFHNDVAHIDRLDISENGDAPENGDALLKKENHVITVSSDDRALQTALEPLLEAIGEGISCISFQDVEADPLCDIDFILRVTSKAFLDDPGSQKKLITALKEEMLSNRQCAVHNASFMMEEFTLPLFRIFKRIRKESGDAQVADGTHTPHSPHTYTHQFTYSWGMRRVRTF